MVTLSVIWGAEQELCWTQGGSGYDFTIRNLFMQHKYIDYKGGCLFWG